MALVVLPVKLPAVLDGQSNGKLDSDILISTPGLAGGPAVRFVSPAARAWVALSGTAPMVLKATSSADSYRTYAQQLATWHARYEPDPFPGYINTRWWPAHYDELGRWVAAHLWYQKPDTAVAAYPGNSNHGWGLAIDVATASGARLAWLQANVVRFGWSFETQSEPWHIRYCAGDDIPAAVLAYEQEHSMASDLDAFVPPLGGVRENGFMAHHLLLAIIKGTAPVDGYWNGPGAPAPNNLWSLLKRVESKLDQVLAKPPVASAPVDVEALAAALANNPVFVEAVKDACGSALEDTRGTITYGP